MNDIKKKVFAFTLTMTLTFFSYGKEVNKIDEEFYIPVKESNLYVRLVGNPNKPIIIDLHGGPGAFSGFNHEFYRHYLEDDYLVAYLDQRGSGKSDVCENIDLLTMDQFVKDLDLVVDTLQNRYENQKINLLGGSWGGTYGLLYLISHQEKVNSFACISGIANSVYQNNSLIEYEEKLAKELLEKSDNQEDIKRYEDIIKKLSEIKKSEFNQFFDDMNLIKHSFPKELGFSAYWANPEDEKKVGEILKDSAVFKRAKYTEKILEKSLEKYDFVNEVFQNTQEYNLLDITDKIGEIKTPMLVLQGELDYNIGIKQAGIIYNSLTSVAEGNKELVIIPNVAHNLTIEAPEEFFGAIKSFFDKNNH